MISARSLLASPLVALLLSVASAAGGKNNPADQLVALINSNRTASKASSHDDNQVLGCIALQYIKAYEGQCDQVGQSKKPMETSFAETFAQAAASKLRDLQDNREASACQSNHATPNQAFDFLVNDAKSLQVLHSKNHTEVGAAVSGSCLVQLREASHRLQGRWWSAQVSPSVQDTSAATMTTAWVPMLQFRSVWVHGDWWLRYFSLWFVL